MKARKASFPGFAIACILMLGFSLPRPAWALAPDPISTDVSDSSVFVAVASGFDHSCAVLASGGVKCWGGNRGGQLGNGTFRGSSIPVEVNGITDAVSVAAGIHHTCALGRSGWVRCWGSNNSGQLGDGTTADRPNPVAVMGLQSGVRAIAAGYWYTTCALLQTGGVKCWGNNAHGQLGNGSTTSSNVPVAVSGLSSGVTGIAAGAEHACAVMQAGQVKCWGHNGVGELGDGTKTERHVPVEVRGSQGIVSVTAGGAHTCALESSGLAKCWGSNYAGALGNTTVTESTVPVDVQGLLGAVAIMAGSGHTCAITYLGLLYCWGSNVSGQLGDGTTVDRQEPVRTAVLVEGMVAAATGWSHTCAISNVNQLYCWGQNRDGQLGNGRLGQHNLPVDVLYPAVGTIAAITAGEAHTCTLHQDDAVYCWGANEFGQLGNGTFADWGMPATVRGLTSAAHMIEAGLYHTCAALRTGGVMCWGANWQGQLGNGSTVHAPTPVLVNALPDEIVGLAAGHLHTCVLLRAGGVKCWGLNYHGQLGDGTNIDQHRPVDVVGLQSGVRAISAGYYHSCALMQSGSMKCWGYGAYGQLGNGSDALSFNTPIDVSGLNTGVIAIDAGYENTCAVLYTGGLKCWGSNYLGQVGDGTYVKRRTPVDVIGLGARVHTVTIGTYHTCALLETGAIKCWGVGYYGQLGNGSIVTIPAPQGVSGLAGGATALVTGSYHSCALVGGGRLKCWGWDGSGQLGLGAIGRYPWPRRVVDAAAPVLHLNYTTGRAGSVFTLTGEGFPADSVAALTANGAPLAGPILTDATGGFIVFVDTAQAQNGDYLITASVNPAASTTFSLSPEAPLRPVEGSGATVFVPSGSATALNRVYLPWLNFW